MVLSFFVSNQVFEILEHLLWIKIGRLILIKLATKMLLYV